MEAITGTHYKENRRNLSCEEEEKILSPFKEKAEAGQIVEVGEIKAAYIPDNIHISFIPPGMK